MAEIKKDQERDELFRRIYKIATDLVHAGHVAEWDFKSYVLGTMFYRYISENFTAYINEGEYAAGNKAFDYAKMPDAEAETAREGLVQEKGFHSALRIVLQCPRPGGQGRQPERDAGACVQPH